MKKLSILLILIFAASFSIISCEGGDDATQMGWTNGSTSTVKDIVWMSGDQEVKKWDGVTGIDASTEKKEISERTGQGECLNEGGDQEMEIFVLIDGQNVKNFTVEKGSTDRYSISQVQAKK